MSIGEMSLMGGVRCPTERALGTESWQKGSGIMVGVLEF